MNKRHIALAQMKPPTEQEARLMRAAFLADPDAWKYPRLSYSYSRRLNSIKAAERWIGEPEPVAPTWIARLAGWVFPRAGVAQ